MYSAFHLWTLVCALIGIQVLHTCTAAPTSSISLFSPSNFPNRWPCTPALINTIKSSRFPISTLCTKPTNATHQVGAPFWASPPFALFCMEDLSPELINSILEKAYDDPSVKQWWFYLATASYAPAPRKGDDPKDKHWTKDPIDASFHSPFIGKTLADAAHWLQNKPESVNLDSHFFGLLDKQAEISGKVVLCRIGDEHLKGDEVTCVLWKAETSTLTLVGQEFGDWDGLISGHPGPYTPDI